MFQTWDSFAADAAKDSIHKTRKDLDRHGEMATQVAKAARDAERDVEQVKSALARLRAGVVTAAKTDIVRDIWLKAMGENPTGIDARIAPRLEDIGKIKGLSRVGGVMGIITAVPAVLNDVGHGKTWGKAVFKEGAGLASGTTVTVAATEGSSLVGAMLAGAAAGGEDGALAGSVDPRSRRSVLHYENH